VSWRNIIWMSIILSLAGLALFLSRRKAPEIRQTDPAVKDLAGAINAYKQINRRAVRPLPPAEAVGGAIAGLVRAVDEFSMYVPPDQTADFARRLSGRRSGTGLRIVEAGDRLVVIGPEPDSPAHEAELFAGCQILAIGDVPAEDLTLRDARRRLNAAPGKTVTIRVRRPDGVRLTRDLETVDLHFPTVVGIVRGASGQWDHSVDQAGGIVYVRIREFVKQTCRDFDAFYRRLDEPAGLILDLRGNPGGSLPPAAELADGFCREGLIVRTTGPAGSNTYTAHADGTYPPVPVVVLIDGGTASAAEIVAGALRVHRRAALIGAESYGKFCLQTNFDLGYGLGRIHLTTAWCMLARSAGSAEPAPDPPAEPDTARAPLTTRAGRDRRPRLRPDVAVTLPVRVARRLRQWRARASVMPAPAGFRTTAPRPAELKALILERDEQLARAIRWLRDGERLPPDAPAAEPEARRTP